MFIIRAAIMYSNGEVVEGRDYGYITALAHKLGLSTPDQIEGFVTASGVFVLPGEAAKIAQKSGQVDKKIAKLSPEHLWAQPVLE